MIQRFNISSLVRERTAQRSFHVAAEQHLRIEYRNLSAGEAVGPFTYQGDLVVTCYRGALTIDAGEDVVPLGELDQAVVPVGTRIRIECHTAGTVQLIWAPPHAKTTQR